MLLGFSIQLLSDSSDESLKVIFVRFEEGRGLVVHVVTSSGRTAAEGADVIASIASTMSLEVQLQTATSEYQKLETDLSNAVEARQKLDSQLSENSQVKEVCYDDSANAPQFSASHPYQEFAQLKSSNTIYKLMGPVLVKQDQAEAKANVETRLEYIRGEM